MFMKTRSSLILALAVAALLAVVLPLGAQAAIPGTVDFRTGDTSLDDALQEAEDLSATDPAGFLKSVANSYGLPAKDLLALKDLGLKAGEILVAVNLAKVTKKTLAEVAANWKLNKGKGWAQIAKELGLKPGSATFQTLKKNAIAEIDRLKIEDAKKPAGDSMMKTSEKNKDASGMKKP
jgi:hypothetical protein